MTNVTYGTNRSISRLRHSLNFIDYVPGATRCALAPGDHISRLRRSLNFIDGIPGATRCALAPGYHISRLRRSLNFIDWCCRGDALRACPWLSYFAPSALAEFH